jgi:cytoskeletal protein CcmA (bactofilin family)
MTFLPKGLLVQATIRAGEDVAIAGTVKGEILAEHHEVVVEPGGRVEGNVTAHTLTIAGTLVGRVIATSGVRLSRTAWVKAEIAAPSLSMDDGAIFNGSVEPARVEAALRVAAYRRRG